MILKSQYRNKVTAKEVRSPEKPGLQTLKFTLNTFKDFSQYLSMYVKSIDKYTNFSFFWGGGGW